MTVTNFCTANIVTDAVLKLADYPKHVPAEGYSRKRTYLNKSA